MHCIRNILAVFMASALATAAARVAQADDGGQPTFVPVDMMSCSFKEGKDWDDLETLNKSFISWVEKQDPGYTYWIFTPRYHESNEFDFAWLGGWADGNAMGAGWDAWMESGAGGDAGKAFAETVDCSASLGTSLEVTRVEGAWPETGVTWFARCELQGDATIFDALAAHRTAAAEMNTIAPPSSSWLFLPALGQGDPDFDYWHVQAFDSYAALGASFEAYFNGGGWSTEAQLNLNEVEMCDIANLYDFRLMYDPASP